ncbi:ferredoxin--NADP reductase [Chryseobacterium culicis]|uniref:Ring-1,2-phenylacetyl-CoA epoxidase subunit PaaE n=1 Tax=Chryseobacterium culicis TaxID=680127 RepID=A0A1H6H3A7_CHRCI|nr:ferredoxin--NADP reductase [Chryseobacterium culicis]SEH28680.1 ring-1,2-phenylacetyl-CoA epoxidase subunit PaaE [Chryseobacterium culicis]
MTSMRNVFHKLKVADKSFLTEDAVLLTFDVTEDLKSSFVFESGQYVTLKSEINNEEIRRSYSICTSPEENSLSVVVKAIDGGVFSTFVKNRIEVGDDLEVSVPEGRFVYHISENSAKNIFLVAAGSGITPIISIVKNILNNEPLSKVTLLFANKQIEDTIFLDQLKALEAQFKETLKVIYIFSRKKQEHHHFGRIDYDFLDTQIHKELDVKSFSEFYTCGPEELVKTVHDYLLSIEIPKELIKSELFYSLEGEVGIEEIISEEVKSGQTKVEVIIDQESHYVTVDHKNNLLESLLNEGLDIPYSCKKGNCSSCVGKVISGTVNMKETDVLMDYEIEDGFILSCQSVPTSEELTISYDEY